MRQLVFASLFAHCCIASDAALAQSVAGETNTDLVSKCEICHGPSGLSVDPDVPIIAGFSYDGFLDTIAAFRDDERVGMEFSVAGEPDRVMNDIARSLQPAQIEMLANYFSSKPFEAAIQQFDLDLAEQGAALHNKHCDKCHSEGGSDPQDDAAILAGQWMPYLSRQFINMESGKRIVPKRMAKKIRRLSVEDKKALVHFYGRNRLSAAEN